jgi:hypothetical protein
LGQISKYINKKAIQFCAAQKYFVSELLAV